MQWRPWPTSFRILWRMLMFATFFWHLKYVFYPLMGSRIFQASPPPITILVWTWPSLTPQTLSPNVCATLLGIPNCWLTNNRSTFSQADAVVFHHGMLIHGKSEFPVKQRPPGQVWVWATLESPSHTRGLHAFNNTFNWTMTYRRDSDIFVPYGLLVPQKARPLLIQNKTGLVSWVISNYRKNHKRAVYFQKLSEHLKVDVFGRAAKKSLCSSCLIPTVSKYKFYLAFENSVHLDYITEKMWVNAFAAGAVPVVLGPPRDNYEHFVPADSFIHVDDFATPEELARFLMTMNSSQYQRYFRWRENSIVKQLNDWRERFCSICTKYHSLPKGKVYKDLAEWFSD